MFGKELFNFMDILLFYSRYSEYQPVFVLLQSYNDSPNNLSAVKENSPLKYDFSDKEQTNLDYSLISQYVSPSRK